MEFELYFRRQIELWGVEVQKSLGKSRILIIGCGGLGSTLALALGGSGIGTIHLVDFDEVNFHNIHRQIAFTIKDEGKNKAAVTAGLLMNKNPFLTVTAFENDFENFSSKYKNSYDLILDATDNMVTRKKIDTWAKQNSVPWIYASVEEFRGQVCFFERADFEVFSYAEDHIPVATAAPMVMQIGSFQANLALRYLAGMEIQKDWLHYFYYDRMGGLEMQKFAMPGVRPKDI
jgi:adenylyltransferase/sulfurtransferase